LVSELEKSYKRSDGEKERESGIKKLDET